jgi:hypothetical protein
MNHAPQDIGRKHYDWHAYTNEKREALDGWSRALQSILDGRPGNVVMLKSPRARAFGERRTHRR